MFTYKMDLGKVWEYRKRDKLRIAEDYNLDLDMEPTGNMVCELKGCGREIEHVLMSKGCSYGIILCKTHYAALKLSGLNGSDFFR